jgi:hypothetical protein
MYSPEETRIDFTNVPMVLGVPRYMYRASLRFLLGAAKAAVNGQKVACFEQELKLWFFLGVVRQRWKDRHYPPGTVKDATSFGATTP